MPQALDAGWVGRRKPVGPVGPGAECSAADITASIMDPASRNPAACHSELCRAGMGLGYELRDAGEVQDLDGDARRRGTGPGKRSAEISRVPPGWGRAREEHRNQPGS